MEFWRILQKNIIFLPRVQKDLLGLKVLGGDIERVSKKLGEIYILKEIN
jgi:hypothetical protein